MKLMLPVFLARAPKIAGSLMVLPLLFDPVRIFL